MAIIRGDDQFLVFKKLLDEVGEKSTFQQSVALLNNKQRITLSEEIQKQSGFIAPNTLRDYRFKYERRAEYSPFSAQSEILSVLTDFLGEGTWQAYYTKHGNNEDGPVKWSCYEHKNPFEKLLKSKDQLADIAQQKAQLLRAREHDPVLLHDLGVCYLGMGQPRIALPFISKCVEIVPFHAFCHFWYAMALMDGKRPFRHIGPTIEKILEQLTQADGLKENFVFSQQLRSFVYFDYHDRIGYSRPETLKCTLPFEKEFLWMLSVCTSLSLEELESTIS